MNNTEISFGSTFPKGGSDFAKQLIANYNKPKSQIAFENLQKIDKGFTPDNLFALAFMATNEGIPEEDREIFKQLLQTKLDENLAAKIKIQPLEKVEPN